MTTQELSILVQTWNQTRLRLEALRKEQQEMQSQYDGLSRRVLQYLQDHPSQHVQIRGIRVFPKDVRHYPHLSQRFLRTALENIYSSQEGQRIWKQILEYRQKQVVHVVELGIKNVE